MTQAERDAYLAVINSVTTQTAITLSVAGASRSFSWRSADDTVTYSLGADRVAVQQSDDATGTDIFVGADGKKYKWTSTTSFSSSTISIRSTGYEATAAAVDPLPRPITQIFLGFG